MSISPDLISLAMLATALRPDEHCRLVVLIGTLRCGAVSERVYVEGTRGDGRDKEGETHV
jgi:hypothetical protein